MGNRKCISSEEVFGKREEKSEEVVQKYQSLAGAKAISSDMFFGKNQAAGGGAGGNFGDDMEGYIMGRSSINSNNSYDEYKQTAHQIAEKVTESAKVLKDKALDWFSTFSTGA